MHGTTIDRRSLLVRPFRRSGVKGGRALTITRRWVPLFTRQSSASRQSLIAQYIKMPNLYILVIDKIPILRSGHTGLVPSERQELDYYHSLAVSSLMI